MPRNMVVRLGVDASDFKRKMAQAGIISAETSAKIKNAMASSGVSGVRQMLSEMEAARSAIARATEGMDISRPLSEQIKALSEDRDKIASEMAKVSKKISEAMEMPTANTDLAHARQEYKIRSLKTELSGLRGAYAAVNDELIALKDAAGNIDPSFMRFASHAGLQQLDAEISALKGQLREYTDTQAHAEDATEQTSRQAGRLGTAFRSAGSWLKQGAKNILRIGSSAKESGSGVEGLLRSIRRLGIVSLGLRFVRSIFGELGSIVHQYVSENAALQAQVNGLKSAFGQALAPAINLVTNALSALMPYIVGISNAIGSLLAKLPGAGWASLAADATAAKNAINGAGGAQKEFVRSLQGFDEITKLSDKSSGGGGGSVTDAVSGVQGILPNWANAMIEDIQRAVQEKNWKGVGVAIADSLNRGIDAFSDADVSIGQRIGNWLSGGVDAAVGLVGGVNWKKLGTAILTNVKDLFSSIDWYAVFSGVGSVGGAVVSWLGNSLAGLKDWFKGYMEKAVVVSPEIADNIGLQIADGVFFAILDGVDWLAEHLWTPLVEHLWTPLKEGFMKTFEGTGWAKLFGADDTNAKAEIDVEANITGINDEVRTKDLDKFTAIVRSYQDNIGSKKLQNGTMVVTTVEDKANSKTFGNGTLWINKVVDNTQSKKLSGGTLQINTVEDKAKSKVFTDGKLQVSTVEDKSQNKVFGNGTLQMSTVVDKTQDKTFKNGKLWIHSIADKAQDKTFTGGLLRVDAWKDNIGADNKNLTLSANVQKGWSGSLESSLGISSLYAKLYVDAPDVKVKWSTSTAPGGGTKVDVPVYEMNAVGAIFSSASLLGVANGKWQVAGEAGREALLPLDRHTWWMDDIAERVVSRISGGGAGGEQDITVNLIADGKTLATTVVRHINAQARATGRNPLAAYI